MGRPQRPVAAVRSRSVSDDPPRRSSSLYVPILDETGVGVTGFQWSHEAGEGILLLAYSPGRGPSNVPSMTVIFGDSSSYGKIISRGSLRGRMAPAGASVSQFQLA